MILILINKLSLIGAFLASATFWLNSRFFSFSASVFAFFSAFFRSRSASRSAFRFFCASVSSFSFFSFLLFFFLSCFFPFALPPFFLLRSYYKHCRRDETNINLRDLSSSVVAELELELELFALRGRLCGDTSRAE